MKRTQIYLDEAIFKYLEQESRIKHKSISEIIRKNIRSKMKSQATNQIAKMNNIFGMWRDMDIEPDEYIRKLRQDRSIIE